MMNRKPINDLMTISRTGHDMLRQQADAWITHGWRYAERSMTFIPTGEGRI